MSRIQMGNDEFILYIRKRESTCEKTTSELGGKIWKWIHEQDPTARIVEEDQPCRWGSDDDSFVNEANLPKTATQFEFNRELLPKLYDYLDTL